MSINVRENILNAALTLFREKGYLKTSMDDVAKEVGLTKGGIYYHIGKKEDLLVEIHNKMIDTFLDKMTIALELESEFSKKINNWVKTHVAIMHDFEPHIKVFFKEIDNIPESELISIQKKRDSVQAMLSNVIAAGIKNKELRNDIDPNIVSFLILGMLNWLYQWYRPTGRRTVEEICDNVNKILNCGILNTDYIARSDRINEKHVGMYPSNEQDGELDQ